jgi:hypothetical protein
MLAINPVERERAQSDEDYLALVEAVNLTQLL